MLVMFSSREVLFRDANQRWPDRIDLEQVLSPNGNIVSDPPDHEIYREIEKCIGSESDWSQLAAWSFHQALGNLIRLKHSQGCLHVLTKDVTFEMFDEMMLSNLEHETWASEREIYTALPTRLN